MSRPRRLVGEAPRTPGLGPYCSCALTDFDDGPLHIDFETRQVTVGGTLIHLTAGEYDLLSAFAFNQGQTLSFEEIEGLTSRDMDGLGRGSVAAKIRCLRLYRKLGLNDDDLWDGPIAHEPGVGYRYGRWP